MVLTPDVIEPVCNSGEPVNGGGPGAPCRQRNFALSKGWATEKKVGGYFFSTMVDNRLCRSEGVWDAWFHVNPQACPQAVHRRGRVGPGESRVIPKACGQPTFRDGGLRRTVARRRLCSSVAGGA